MPVVIATSITREPQALPTVPMSTPWSSVQDDGDSTRELGRSGNTHPDVEGAGSELARPTVFPAPTQFRSVVAVRTPTVPLGGLRRAARWKIATDALVCVPKTPSTEVGTRTWFSQRWSVVTSPPWTPTLSTRENGAAVALLAASASAAHTVRSPIDSTVPRGTRCPRLQGLLARAVREIGKRDPFDDVESYSRLCLRS